MAKQPIEAKWNTGRTETNEEGVEVAVYDSAIVEFDLGENLADAVAQFGEDAIFTLYAANARVQLQGAIRAQGEAGVDASEIPARLAAYKPGVRVGRIAVDPVAALRTQYANADDAGKEDILAKIMGEED